MPEPDFVSVQGIFIRQRIDGLLEWIALVDTEIHSLQIDGSEKLSPPAFTEKPIIEPFRRPFDQDVPDIENDRLDAHALTP
jgi:hypothetical protein